MKADHWLLLAKSIREQLDELDQVAATPMPPTRSDYFRIVLGSKQQAVMFCNIEQVHADDLAFTDFTTRLGSFFTNYLGEQVEINSNEMVGNSDTALISTRPTAF